MLRKLEIGVSRLKSCWYIWPRRINKITLFWNWILIWSYSWKYRSKETHSGVRQTDTGCYPTGNATTDKDKKYDADYNTSSFRATTTTLCVPACSLLFFLLADLKGCSVILFFKRIALVAWYHHTWLDHYWLLDVLRLTILRLTVHSKYLNKIEN